MDRRLFLSRLLLGTGAASLSLAGAGPFAGFPSAKAAPLTPVVPRTLVHIMLIGGADLRYLFVPAPGSTYADLFWEARQDLYVDGQGNPLYQSYDEVWATEYLTATDPRTGTIFGIHRNANWLHEQFLAGRVAVVANTVGSTNRRHDHSQLIAEAGDRYTTFADVYRDGWGDVAARPSVRQLTRSP